MADRPGGFDPLALLAALERQRVAYVVIGGLARVIHGTGETTEGLDITASTRPENVRRLDAALSDLDARRGDGTPATATSGESPTAVATVLTDHGSLTIVDQPVGTRGYDDLRRRATREPLGRGLRPAVAAPEDLARMLSALDRESDGERLRRIRRVIALDRQPDLGR